jgi:hypothetical protein
MLTISEPNLKFQWVTIREYNFRGRKKPTRQLLFQPKSNQSKTSWQRRGSKPLVEKVRQGQISEHAG